VANQEREDPRKPYTEIINDIRNNIALTKKIQVIGSKETNWYKHASKVIDRLKVVHGITPKNIEMHILYHNLDTLPFDEKMTLVSHLFSVNDDINDLETRIKQYFDDRFIVNKTKKGVYLVNRDGILKSFIQVEGDNIWPQGSTNDEIEFARAKSLNKFKIAGDDFADVVGFMILFKKHTTFKIKDITQSRNRGAHCESAGKTSIIKLLNRTVGEPMYTDENSEEIYKIGMCAMTEILLRENTRTKKDDKHWFLGPEETIFSSVVKYQR
jgi:hypothetical protein